MNAEIKKLVADFAVQIVDVVRAEVRDELLGKLSGTGKPIANGKPRKKGPIQLCPAPGCTGRAAPVFGMLCGKHKGAPKATVAKWREARRKAAAKPASKPVTAKPAVKKK